MKFKRLRIANFRGVASCEVNFAPSGITLIQGPNEVGKTSLREAIAILFEFPDSSKHRLVEVVRPVHRDEGPEIELHAESGSYDFTYHKRFYRKPETRLSILRPKPENHTGREAHDRAETLLSETIDVGLWRALTIQQGEAIAQPDLSKQTSLSAALDKAAGGHAADPRQEGLFDKAREEYSRYFTDRGSERKELAEARKKHAEAENEVLRIEHAIRDLDLDIDRAAALQRELGQLRRKEAELSKEVLLHTASLEEIGALESSLSEARLKMEAARKSEQIARQNKEIRQGLIDAVENAQKAYKRIVETSDMSLEDLNRADEDLKREQTAFAEADRRRKEADRLAALRRADFDYYNNKLHLEQLYERKERIDHARRSAIQAEEVLVRNKVDHRLLKKIQDAERNFLTATAQFETGAPSVSLRSLSDCRLVIDDLETRLGKGQIKTISVAERSKVSIPGILDFEVTAGSSTEGLSRKLEEAGRLLQEACTSAGVVNPDAARTAFEERREALRQIENKAQVEKENLRDLTYEQLERKVFGLQKGVPDYLAKRVPEPPICPDFDSAKRERANGEAAQRQVNSEWEAAGTALNSARSLREGLNVKHQETRVQLDLLAKDLHHAQENLEKARKSISDDLLVTNLAEAMGVVAKEEANVASAEASLNAKNPERVKILAETVRGSLQTTQTRRTEAQTEFTEVQTRLKIHGEEGLHEKLHQAQIQLERISYENQSLFRRAAVAKLLFESMRDERDKARRAYVAPLKEKIEGLGRLVFDETFQVDIDEDLQIASRTSNGVTISFESLSGGTKEQLSLIFRVACSMIIAKDGGTPLLLDDALGYTDPERLRLMGTVLAKAAKECQIVIFTCMPERYGNIGAARVVSLTS